MSKLFTPGFSLPYDPELVDWARELRGNMTPAEKQLWYGYLRGLQIRFMRQRPIDHYIVDFYCPELKLIIEVDGDSHISPDEEKYDEERSRVLEGYGLRILRFTNQDIFENFESVCVEIEKRIPPTPLT
jgi:very-short-patch-repair endonuclease